MHPVPLFSLLARLEKLDPDAALIAVVPLGAMSTAQRSIDDVTRLLVELGARNLSAVSNDRVHVQILLLRNSRVVLLKEIYSRNGELESWDVYTPLDESNSRQATFDALRAYADNKA